MMMIKRQESGRVSDHLEETVQQCQCHFRRVCLCVCVCQMEREREFSSLVIYSNKVHVNQLVDHLSLQDNFESNKFLLPSV